MKLKFTVEVKVDESYYDLDEGESFVDFAKSNASSILQDVDTEINDSTAEVTEIKK